jgi:hypothetical protein
VDHAVARRDAQPASARLTRSLANFAKICNPTPA